MIPTKSRIAIALSAISLSGLVLGVSIGTNTNLEIVRAFVGEETVIASPTPVPEVLGEVAETIEIQLEPSPSPSPSPIPSPKPTPVPSVAPSPVPSPSPENYDDQKRKICEDIKKQAESFFQQSKSECDAKKKSVEEKYKDFTCGGMTQDDCLKKLDEHNNEIKNACDSKGQNEDEYLKSRKDAIIDEFKKQNIPYELNTLENLCG